MRRLFVTLAIAAPLGASIAAGPAHAIPIFQSISLSTNTADAMLGQPSGPSVPLYNLFDPTLGTLDYVDIRVTGALSLNWFFPPFFSGPNVVVPYQVSGHFEQRLDSNDFSLLIDPFFVYSVVAATGGNTAFVHDYNFRFDATSDLVGLTTAHGTEIHTPGVTSQGITPGLVNGSRSNFVGSGPAALVSQWTYTSVVPPLAPGFLNYSYNGTMLITYEYTPTPPPTSVPEPGSLTLLGAGLAAMAFMRRRTSAKTTS